MSYNRHYMTYTPNYDIQSADQMSTFVAHLRRIAAAGEIAPTTCDTYATGLRHWSTFLADRGIPEMFVTADTVYEWLSNMRERGISARSSSTWLAAVRRYAQWRVSHGLADADPTEDIRLRRPDVRRHKKDSLPDVDVLRLLSVAESLPTRDRAIILLKVYCGLRDVEVVRIDAEHIGQRLDASTQQYRRVVFIRGKGHVDQDDFVVVEHPAVWSALSTWLAERGEHHGPLFTSDSPRNRGERLNVRSVKRIVVDAMRTAGVKRSGRITSHSLRHTAITKVARAAGLSAAQVFARHSRAETTAGYVHDDFRLANPAELLIEFSPSTSTGEIIQTSVNPHRW